MCYLSDFGALCLKKRMRITLLLISIIVFFSCFPREKEDVIQEGIISEPISISTPESQLNYTPYPVMVDSVSHQASYKKLISDIRKEKNRLRNQFDNGMVSLDEVGDYFQSIMRDSVFHYWYGTPWDFNGYSAIPRKGVIACGYFISTPLKQIGLNVNRYKLAQQAATPIIKSVVGTENVTTYHQLEDLVSYLETQPTNSLHVIGLTNHVGYILRENGMNYMVHADYYHPVAICKKKLEECEAILSSDIYVLGGLSNNHKFLSRWLYETPIIILRQ